MFVGKNFLDAKKRHISKAYAIALEGDGYFCDYFCSFLPNCKYANRIESKYFWAFLIYYNTGCDFLPHVLSFDSVLQKN